MLDRRRESTPCPDDPARPAEWALVQVPRPRGRIAQATPWRRVRPLNRSWPIHPSRDKQPLCNLNEKRAVLSRVNSSHRLWPRSGRWRDPAADACRPHSRSIQSREQFLRFDQVGSVEALGQPPERPPDRPPPLPPPPPLAH